MGNYVQYDAELVSKVAMAWVDELAASDEEVALSPLFPGTRIQAWHRVEFVEPEDRNRVAEAVVEAAMRYWHSLRRQ